MPHTKAVFAASWTALRVNFREANEGRGRERTQHVLHAEQYVPFIQATNTRPPYIRYTEGYSIVGSF